MTIIIRSSLDANSVSERGLQSWLVNNYDRISKAALKNKWNVESTCLLTGLEVQERSCLPARHGAERPKDLITNGFWIFHARVGPVAHVRDALQLLQIPVTSSMISNISARGGLASCLSLLSSCSPPAGVLFAAQWTGQLDTY